MKSDGMSLSLVRGRNLATTLLLFVLAYTAAMTVLTMLWDDSRGYSMTGAKQLVQNFLCHHGHPGQRGSARPSNGTVSSRAKEVMPLLV